MNEYEILTGSGVVVAEAETHTAALRLVDECYRLDYKQGPFTCRPIQQHTETVTVEAPAQRKGVFARLFS